MLVQFGNNWIPKIPRTANLAVLGIFLIQLFPNWTACSPITYTNRTMCPQGSSSVKEPVTFTSDVEQENKEVKTVERTNITVVPIPR